MTHRTLVLATLAAALTAAGAAAAAQSGAPSRAAGTEGAGRERVVSAGGAVGAGPLGAARFGIAPPAAPGPPCSARDVMPSASAEAPSARLLAALAVLRRPRTNEDAVPPAELRDSFVDGVMTDAARRVAADTWLVPVTSVFSPPRCRPGDPPGEPPVEGVAIVNASVFIERYPTDAILAGRAFSIRGCTGSMHDRITVEGIVPDGASEVTLTARDGSIVQATPEGNVVRFDLARPQSAAGLPAHIGSGSLQYRLNPLTVHGLDRPCEPPTPNSIGQRREPPTALGRPAGAAIELQTTRWQPEDTGPRIAGATYRRAGRRCLLVAPERRLRAGGRAHRFCVDDRRLRRERFVARATRVDGYVVLEGFVDRAVVSAIVVERSLRPGAHRLATARRSGAFFMAVRGRFAAGGAFRIHAALRGTPVRYTGLRDVRLGRRTG
jgi:hypothetical protein